MSRKQSPSDFLIGMPCQISARWGPRAETSEQITARVHDCMARLSGISTLMNRWYRVAMREYPLESDRIDFHSIESVRKWVHESITMGDYGEPVEWGGCSLAACNAGKYNDHDETCIGIHSTVGSTSFLGNTFSIEWDRYSRSPLLRDVPLVYAVIESLAMAWDADWCEVEGLFVPPIKQSRLELDYMCPHVGWMIYLKNRELQKTDVPSAWNVLSCSGKGSLVVVREAPINMSVPADVQLADRVREELGIPRYWRDAGPERRCGGT